MKYAACALAFNLALCASRAESQTFKTLVQFSGTGGTTTGANPGFDKLTIVGTTLYGMTQNGGPNSCGNIFSVGVDGSNFQNLVSFTGTGGTASGNEPTSSLTVSGTTLYGSTWSGGANGSGNIFSIGIGGVNYQNLVSFTGTGGAAIGQNPGQLLILGTSLYGMTGGNIFSVGTNGSNFQNLVSFTGSGGTATGSYGGIGLVLSGTRLYGMTTFGGANRDGNVFSVGADGTSYQNLLSFTGTSGAASGDEPRGSLTINGTTLYGMTLHGGAYGFGNIFSVGINGSNYQNLVSFTGTGGTASGEDGLNSLTLAGTTLYGVTFRGGAEGNGNIFSLGIDGSNYRDLYDFTGGADGRLPLGDLTLSGGTLFGMASEGGATVNYYGTVFALTLPTPEPGTLGLAGSAAAVLVAYRWRRRRLRGRSVAGGRIT